jgi:hypothetical protein
MVHWQYLKQTNPTAAKQLAQKSGNGKCWRRGNLTGTDRRTCSTRRYTLYGIFHGEMPDAFPFETAAQIVAQPQKFPRYLVYMAEGRCQLEIESKLPPRRGHGTI